MTRPASAKALAWAGLLLLTTGCTPADAEARLLCYRLESCDIHAPGCEAVVAKYLPEQNVACQMCLMARTCRGYRVGLDHNDRGICEDVCE
ncbi:MAG: hypothetical protein IPI67_16565 [Myxococcales bacterium]|nr:hypothetical protein [Myxococcales bacterium]